MSGPGTPQHGAQAPDASTMWLEVPLAATADSAAASAERLQALGANHPGKLVVSSDIPPAALEQYRRLAAVLYQAQANRGIKTAMVTSAYAAEGKSLTATNIALTLSESYDRRVLLIDADLRRPTLHDIFQIPNLAGLSDWLRSESAGRMPLVQISRRLTLLPGGRPDPDPMAGLASERMTRVLALAAAKFDWVILDTPPVALLPDGHLLSHKVDTAVFVVAAGRSPSTAVQRAVTELGRDRVIGVVLNRVENRSLHPHDSSYYSRYHYAPATRPDGR